jgi:energy-coupling factor transport system permease protein
VKPGLTYRPGSSFLHRLHPLVKFAWLVGLTGLVFLVQDPAVNLTAAMLLAAVFPLLGISFSSLRGVRLLVSTAVLIGLLQVLFTGEGTGLLTVGPVRVTDQGVLRGVYLASRFLAVVFASYIFVLTTDPGELAYALMQIGLPYRWGFTLVTALRLVPIFESEMLTVYRAQLARGAAYDRSSVVELFRSLRGLLLPMLVSAVSKVDALAVSMEGRCFGRYPDRTYYRVHRTGQADWLALSGLVGLILAGVFWTL